MNGVYILGAEKPESCNKCRELALLAHCPLTQRVAYPHEYDEKGLHWGCPIRVLSCEKCGTELEARPVVGPDGTPAKGISLFCPKCCEED